jgi:nicotinamidase-related amidase
MTYAPLDPAAPVILFADLQKGIVERSTTLEEAQLRRGVGVLARLAQLFSIPVVVTAAPSPLGAPEIVSEIGQVLGDVRPLVRNTTDAFTHAPTREAIERTGRRTLIVSGVATEVIVQHSCLSAAARGYSVQLVVDACGGISPRTEDASLRRLVGAGVVPTSLASLAGQLAGDFTQQRGAQALGILFQMAGG